MTGHDKGTNLFIERSLKSAFGFCKEAIFSDDTASSRGFLQGLDARLKIGLLVIALLVTLWAKSMPFLAGLYLFSVVLAFLSGARIVFFIKRVWFFIPLFTLVIAVPAAFIQGLSTAVIFVLRVTTCVSYIVLVTITTRHSVLIGSLRSLGVPSIFVRVLDMAYRYIFFFIKVFEEMHLGLKARLVGRMDAKESRRWIGSQMAHLFRRSARMSEEVYMAMVARGYAVEEKSRG